MSHVKMTEGCYWKPIPSTLPNYKILLGSSNEVIMLVELG